jgi:DMSO/TMAO reductase YedYZ molybdopterin-dependent catalytic subunit
MQFTKVITLVLFSLAIAAPVRAGTDPDAITIGGSVEKPGDWTVARLKTDLAADISPISYTSHDGTKHSSNAVPLLALLKASGVQTQLKPDPKADPRLKHHELRQVVVVQGRDGYVATFSLAELLGELGNRPAWLAFDIDGGPLPASDGPIKLIVPDDQKPARWVHGIQIISVIDVTPPTTRPAD